MVIVRDAVSPDHIHLLLSAPPILAPAKLAQYIKGRSSRHMQAEFPELRKQVLGTAHVGSDRSRPAAGRARRAQGRAIGWVRARNSWTWCIRTSAAVPEFLRVDKVGGIDIVILDRTSPQFPFRETRFGLFMLLFRFLPGSIQSAP
jgi:hypothetical protein